MKKSAASFCSAVSKAFSGIRGLLVLGLGPFPDDVDWCFCTGPEGLFLTQPDLLRNEKSRAL